MLMFLRVSSLFNKYGKNTDVAVYTGDMEVFSISYVSGSIARQLL
jgi:hypothetical protein